MSVSPLSQELKQFGENTSFHGIAGIINAKHCLWIRLTWIFCFLLMAVIYLFMLTTTIINYYQYPVVTNVEYRTADEIAFPSVTICNMNMARYSAVLQDDRAIAMYTSTPSVTRNLPNLSQPVNMSGINFVNISRVLAHQPEDMYLKCTFDGQRQTSCNKSRMISWTSSPEGMCHTFNSEQIINMYGPTVATKAGGNYGLNLLINIEAYEYFVTNTHAAGVQVLVHDPHVLPNVKETGFAVSAGRETLAAMKKSVVR